MKIIWHDHPDRAVANKCKQLEEIRKKDGSTMYWAVVRETLKKDPWFMMRVALEWAWLDEDLVGNKFIKHIAENWGEDISVLFPRGHGKTLPMSAITITDIINNPDCAILEISRTEDNADKFGETVASHLMYNDYLQKCFGTAHSKNGFLPSSVAECQSWGKDGYSLPNRKPRFDPTLLCLSGKSAIAGKHPDWIYIDDPTEEQNNDPQGWENTIKLINGCKMLLSADGHFVWTGTRWHDADPLGKVETGVLQGKQGPFKSIKHSCFIDDNPLKGVTYARKKRWNMDKDTGYTAEMLDNLKKPEEEGGVGTFFDAQMRNDPSPLERAVINVNDIQIYEHTQKPKIGHVRWFAIETTGGGLPIYNGFQEYLEELKLSLPLIEITNPRKIGVEKRDRIVAALQPIISNGKLHAQQWMVGDKSAAEGLGYELRRIGKARNDDIADALHNVPVHLSKGSQPSSPNDPCDLYISVDLAWSDKQRSDWTVALACAVDAKGEHWVIDYDRFQLSSPTGIYQRLLTFYQKFDESELNKRNRLRGKYPGAWR